MSKAYYYADCDLLDKAGFYRFVEFLSSISDLTWSRLFSNRKTVGRSGV